MGEVEERLARIEVKLQELSDRVSRLERILYGNTDPEDSILQRLSSLESKVSILLKVVVVPITLMVLNMVLQLIR